ncbi:MAG: hypothetical protein JW924_08515 [Fusobacteriaceae bacterium]|nr:hypothetical protein [Fusobacteriaceae bacterium]
MKLLIDFLKELIEILFLRNVYRVRFTNNAIKYTGRIIYIIVLACLIMLRLVIMIFQQITTGFDGFAEFINFIIILMIFSFPVWLFIKWLLMNFNKKISFRYTIQGQLKHFCKGNKFVTINYTPTVLYSFDDDYLTIKFRLDGHGVTKKFTELEDQLGDMLVLQLDKFENKEGFAIYKFRRKPLNPTRISIRDVEENENRKEDLIKINDDISWNFRLDPHGLINGGTGGGKTFFIIYLIRALLELGAILKILDPKRSTLYSLRYFLGNENVACKHQDIADILIKTKEEMNKRYEEIEKKRLKDRKVDADYSEYGYKPIFIIFDELMAFMRGAIDPKTKKEAFDALLEIITMGREAGFFVIIAMQKGSSKSIDVDVRDQLHFRCTLGKMGKEGYVMAFGDGYGGLSKKKTLQGKGTGFIQIYGNDRLEEPQEFYSPYIDKNYNFFDEVEKIVKDLYPEKYTELKEKFKNDLIQIDESSGPDDEIQIDEKPEKQNRFDDIKLDD